MTDTVIEHWHQLVRDHNPAGLESILAEDVVFHSPILHSPQAGKALTTMYLSAAFKVLFNDSFEYVREIINEDNAMLEFSVNLDGIIVNGVDIIAWNEDKQIVDFKVMIRPLKAINLIGERMLAQLQKQK